LGSSGRKEPSEFIETRLPKGGFFVGKSVIDSWLLALSRPAKAGLGLKLWLPGTYPGSRCSLRAVPGYRWAIAIRPLRG
jgi:hypothetical protein